MIIKKIKIKEYKQFKNTELNFKEGLNLIIGCGGSGKTILFNMLKEGILKKNKDYDTEIKGKADKKQIDYIFVDLEKFPEEMIDKYNHHIPYSTLAKGEKTLLALKTVLKYRKTNNIQDPLVLDSPTGYLDPEKRKAFFKILKEVKEQVIIFIRHEIELSDTGLKADFKLIPCIPNKNKDKLRTIINKIK